MFDSCKSRCFALLGVAPAFLLLGSTARAQLPSGTNWALTFADEFNASSVDSMKWSNGHPWDPSSSLASNVTVNGGYLNLNAVRVNSTTFTGAGVSTRPPSGSDLFDMTYGYVEASMKMPSLQGSWPAFWMLENGWPPELDICEFPYMVDGSYSPNWYSDNLHYTASGGANASAGDGIHDPGRGNLTAGFHNYGMRWTPTSVTFYIDGYQQATITDPTAIANLVKSGGGPMYILLDNSGGGNWPGVPSESQWPDGAVSDLQVDWVRVWKDTGGSATAITWKNTASNGVGSWTDSTVWSGGQVPQLSSQTAIFGANSVNNQTVNWNNSQTVGGLTFNSSTSYTIGSASGSLMLTNFTSTGTNTVLIDATAASGSGANYLDSRLELYNNVTMQTSSKPLIVGGNIIGTGNLTIAAGPVSLTNSSSYSGGTTLNGGTLTAAANGALGSGAIQFNSGGGNYTAALALAGNIELDNPIALTGRSNTTAAIHNTSGNNTLGGQIALQAGGSTYAIESDSGRLTLSGAVGGGTAITLGTGVSGTRTVTFLGAANTQVSGRLADGNAGLLAVLVNGSGSVVLTASNSYTGGTTIGGGTLQVGAGGTTGSLATAGSITDNGTLVFDRSNNVAQGADFSAAPISGTGRLVQLGGGTLTLSNSNSYTGGTQVLAGTLLLTGSLNPSGGLAVGGGAFVYAHAGAATQAVNDLTVYAGGSAINNTSASTLALGSITRNAGGTVDFLATLGAITTTATNTNGILGPWAFVGSGSNTAYATATGGTIGAYAGATLESSSGSAWGGIPSGDNHTVNYEITANGSFPQTGFQCNVNTIQYAGSGGTQTSSSTGVLLVANGILNTGTGPLVIGGGGNQLNVQIGTNKELVVGTFTGGIVINNVLSDSSSGASALTKTGSATLTLAGANTYSGGTYIDAGAIGISADSNLGATGSSVTLNGGMLTATAGITNTHPFTIGASGGTINVNAGTGQYYFHTANTLLGSGPLTLTGPGTLAANSGNLRVDQANTYSGSLTVQSGGIFEYGTAGAVASGATFTIKNQGELAVQGGSAVSLPNRITVSGGINSVLSFENGTAGVFSGPIVLNASAIVGLRDWYNNATVRSGAITGQISGSGALTINSGTGAGGVLTLSNAANSYSGGTTINASTLVNDLGGSSGATGAISPFGSGLITVGSGAALQLGHNPGSNNDTEFDYANNVNLNAGALYAEDGIQHVKGTVNIGASGGTVGSTYNGGGTDINKGLYLDGPVSGSGSLTVRQSGINTGNNWNTSFVVIANNASSYSGTVTVVPMGSGNGGGSYLGLNAANALAGAAVTLIGNNTSSAAVFGSSPLVFNTGLGAATLGALSGSGNVVLTGYDETNHAYSSNGIALSIGGINTNTTYSGAMSGLGSLTKIGTGTTVLNNNNSYSGATAVNGGTMRLGVDQALPSSTAVTLNGGGLDLNGHSNTISQFIVSNSSMSQSNGALTVTTSADGAVQLGSAVGSSGSYRMSGGSLTVTAGPLDVGWYGNGAFNQTGGQVTTNNFLVIGRQPGSTGVYNISGGTVTNTASYLAVGQQGSGALNVSGSGVVVAGGSGLCVGGLFGGGGNGTVSLNSGGRIQTTAVSADSSGVSTFNFNGGTLQAAAGASANFFSGVSNVVAGTGGAVVDTNGNNISFASALSGPGGLNKAGAGTMVVQSRNTYAGPTIINRGVLQLQSGAPQLAYDFTSGSAVNTGNNASTVTTTPVGSPVISATGGPNGLGAMTLNGSNYLDIQAASLPNLSGSANYTIAMWINTTQAGATLLYKGDGGWNANDENFFLTSVSGNVNSGSGYSGGHIGGVQWAGGWVGGSTNANTGTWKFVSIVRSGGSDTFYVNGVADATSGTNMSLAEQGTQDIRLGFNAGDTGDGALMFRGSISGTYVYGSALTQAQIQSLYSLGPAGVFGSLPATTALSITNSGAALDIDGAQQTVASLSGVAGTSVYLGGGTLTVAGSGSTTFAGDISDSGGASTGIGGRLILSGPGKLVLSGTNSFTGGVTVSGGTLEVLNNHAFPDGTSLTVGNAAAFLAPASILPANGNAAPLDSSGEATAVPEPCAWAILAVAGACMAALRLRKRALRSTKYSERVLKMSRVASSVAKTHQVSRQIVGLRYARRHPTPPFSEFQDTLSVLNTR